MQQLFYPNRTHSISGGNTTVHLYDAMTRFLRENRLIARRVMLVAAMLIGACVPRADLLTPADALERNRIAGEAVRTAPRRAAAWRCTPDMPRRCHRPPRARSCTGFCETTPYEEAMAFLDTIRAKAAPNRIMQHHAARLPRRKAAR